MDECRLSGGSRPKDVNILKLHMGMLVCDARLEFGVREIELTRSVHAKIGKTNRVVVVRLSKAFP